MPIRKITDDQGRLYFRFECVEPQCGNRSRRLLDPIEALRRLERHDLLFH